MRPRFQQHDHNFGKFEPVQFHIKIQPDLFLAYYNSMITDQYAESSFGCIRQETLRKSNKFPMPLECLSGIHILHSFALNVFPASDRNDERHHL
jgi:hypothetical protein